MSATSSRAGLRHASELLASWTVRDRPNSITLSSSLTGRTPDRELVRYLDCVMEFGLTFRVRRSRGEMYSGHVRLCVCLLSVARRMPTLLHGPGCNLGEILGRCPLVAYSLADLIMFIHRKCTVGSTQIEE